MLLSPLSERVDSIALDRFCEDYLDSIEGSDLVYGVGNIIALLIYNDTDLKNIDLRDRTIREVDFQGLELKDVDFSGAKFDRCRFAAGMDTILGISFSPDGKYLAASDTAFKIKIWSVVDNREIATLCGHQGWVWEVTFSPDSKYIATGSSDRTLRVWEVNSGRCLQSIEAHDDWVWKVVFLFNSKTIVTIGADRQIKLWWWEQQMSILGLTVPDLGARDATFCGNGWDIDSGKLILTLSGHPTQVNEIQTNDAGEIITTCLEQVRVWNRYTGDCLRVVNFARNSTICIAYHPDRSRGILATGSDNGVIKIWNLTTGQCTNTNTGNAPRTIALATSHQHRFVISGKDDGIIHIWDFSQLHANIRPPAIVIRAHIGTIFNLAYSPSGELFASAGSDRLIKVWDTKTGDLLHTFSGHTDYIAQIEFADDRYLITRCYNSPLCQWDLLTGESELLPCVADGWVQGFSTTPNGEYLAVGCNAIGMTMWHRTTHEETTYPIAGSRLRRFAHSNDGRWLVAVTDDSILNLWDTHNNYHHQSWRISLRETRSICPHPHNPELLIVGGDDGELAIWHLPTKICIARNRIHQLPILAVNTLLDPDGIVSCGVDGSIRLWELKDRRLIQIYAIEFSKPYQNANFTDVKGLNKSQLTALASMGAKVRSVYSDLAPVQDD